jgi:uncharacterized damage-inducible protein DinB
MNLRDIQLLFDYNYWANELMLTTAVNLSAEQFTQPLDFSWESVRRTLIHTLDSEHMWRNLCQHGVIVNPRLINLEPFPTLESIVAYWNSEQHEMRAYLDSLTDGDMESMIRYEADGNVRERVLWHCLIHVVNHGTQHRSEIATMLTSFGHSPGGIDFTLYMNSRAKR